MGDDRMPKASLRNTKASNPQSLKGLPQEIGDQDVRLEAQTRRLMEILNVNKALRLDLELDDLLNTVARAVQNSLGFGRVLISLHDQKRRIFMKKAQAGWGSEEFRRAQEQPQPEEKLLPFIQHGDEFKSSLLLRRRGDGDGEYDLIAIEAPFEDGLWQPGDAIIAPMSLAQGELLGVMFVENPTDGRLPDMQAIGLMEMFADQAAQAVANALLYQRARAKARAFEILREMTSRIGAQLDFQLLLKKMVEIAKTSLKCRHCAILLWDGGLKTWTYGAPEGASSAQIAELAKVDDVIQQAALMGKPVFSDRQDMKPGVRKLFKGSRFAAHVPLKLGEKLLGLLVLISNQELAFTEQDGLFWSSLSDQMAMAIENAQRYQSAKSHSIRDGLTGLFNHRYFQERLRVEESRSFRHNHPFSVVMMDIDHFKHYNDICGHPTGDKALGIIARLLEAEVRDIDILARYGGEEFAIILTETDKKGAWKVAERIRKKVEDHKFPHGQIQPLKRLTVSIGVAAYPEDADNRKDLVERADEALYMAKKAGRNQVFVSGQSEEIWLR